MYSGIRTYLRFPAAKKGEKKYIYQKNPKNREDTIKPYKKKVKHTQGDYMKWEYNDKIHVSIDSTKYDSSSPDYICSDDYIEFIIGTGSESLFVEKDDAYHTIDGVHLVWWHLGSIISCEYTSDECNFVVLLNSPPYSTKKRFSLISYDIYGV